MKPKVLICIENNTLWDVKSNRELDVVLIDNDKREVKEIPVLQLSEEEWDEYANLAKWVKASD